MEVSCEAWVTLLVGKELRVGFPGEGPSVLCLSFLIGVMEILMGQSFLLGPLGKPVTFCGVQQSRILAVVPRPGPCHPESAASHGTELQGAGELFS